MAVPISQVALRENAEPNVKTDADKDQAEEEWQPPSPSQELFARHLAESQDCKICKEETAGHAELRPGRDEASVVVGARPLHRHQDRTSPLASNADALNEAQDSEDYCSPNT